MRKTESEYEVKKIIRSELSSLKRGTHFYDWRTCTLLYERLSYVLDLIQTGIKDPTDGVELVVKFLNLDNYVCGRCDDSDGGLGYEFNSHAIDVLVPFAREYSDKNKLTEYVYELINEDDYGCHDGVLERVGEILPADKMRELLKRTYDRRYGSNYIYEELAYALNDAPLLISLVESREYGFREDDYKRVAWCYLKSGNLDDSFKWALKMQDASYGQEELLEEIYEKKGDKDSLKKLYEASYLRFPSEETEKKIISLSGETEFQRIKENKIEAIMASHSFSIHDMDFLLDKRLISEAELYLYNRRNMVNGEYFTLPFIKKIKMYCSPLTQTIICRVPLNYYLNNAKSKYYYSAARYLMYLAEISPLVDDWKGVQCHEDYYSELRQKHLRKRAFWAYFE